MSYKVQSTGKPTRIFYEGEEDGAKEYLKNNFPRPHVPVGNMGDLPVTADVSLIGPDGYEQVWNGSEFQNSKDGLPDGSDRAEKVAAKVTAPRKATARAPRS